MPTYRENLLAMYPKRENFKTEDDYLESLGYWQSHQGRILGMQDRLMASRAKSLLPPVNKQSLAASKPPIASDVRELQKPAPSPNMFVSYKHEVPPVLGSRHWYDLSCKEQDGFILSCFRGPEVWRACLQKLDLYDRIGLSIAHSLLGDRFFEYQPKTDGNEERLRNLRAGELKDTLLGCRLAATLARETIRENGGVIKEEEEEESQPMLFFEYLDAAKTKGFEYLSFECLKAFDESEKEAQDELSSLSHEERQRLSKDFEEEMGQFLGVPKEAPKNQNVEPLVIQKRNAYTSLKRHEKRAIVLFLIACISAFVGYLTLSYIIYALLVWVEIWNMIKEQKGTGG
jgi:hypothetical protein